MRVFKGELLICLGHEALPNDLTNKYKILTPNYDYNDYNYILLTIHAKKTKKNNSVR